MYVLVADIETVTSQLRPQAQWSARAATAAAVAAVFQAILFGFAH
jgi:hypothetical protein